MEAKTEDELHSQTSPPSSQPPLQSKSFCEAVGGGSSSVVKDTRFIVASNDNGAGPQGKDPDFDCNPFSISPNEAMTNEITLEKNRLKDSDIFFAYVDVDKCPPRKFMDDWFYNYWNLKLGLRFSFYRQLQKGLFIIFFNSHETQSKVLNKVY